MPELSQEVYHCPACGALASVVTDAEKVCAECGYEFGKPVTISPRSTDQNAVADGPLVQRNVSTRRRSERVEPVLPTEVHTVEELQPDGHYQTDEVVSDDGNKKVVRRRKKRRKVRLGPLLFLGGWAIVVMVVVILVKNHGEVSEAFTENETLKKEEKRKALQASLDAVVLKLLPDCQQTMVAYLSEQSWAGRAQFVRNSSKMAPAMGRYYERNPLWKLGEGSTLTLKSANLYTFSDDQPIIETVFRVDFATVLDENGEPAEEQPEPIEREVAFVRQQGRWLIDWEALVNYSQNSWQKFVRDIDEFNEASEFRLFVRRTRGVVDGKESEKVTKKGAKKAAKKVTSNLVLKFFEPRDDLDQMWRMGSQGVIVPEDSENGLRFLEILERADEVWEPGDSTFGRQDPSELRRVRVKLYWETSADERRFLRVSEVSAGNWYGEGLEGEFRSQLEEESEEGDPKEGDPKEGDPEEGDPEEGEPAGGSDPPEEKAAAGGSSKEG